MSSYCLVFGVPVDFPQKHDMKFIIFVFSPCYMSRKFRLHLAYYILDPSCFIYCPSAASTSSKDFYLFLTTDPQAFTVDVSSPLGNAYHVMSEVEYPMYLEKTKYLLQEL